MFFLPISDVYPGHVHQMHISLQSPLHPLTAGSGGNLQRGGIWDGPGKFSGVQTCRGGGEHCKQRGLVMGETLAVLPGLRAARRMVLPSLGFQKLEQERTENETHNAND